MRPRRLATWTGGAFPRYLAASCRLRFPAFARLQRTQQDCWRWLQGTRTNEWERGNRWVLQLALKRRRAKSVADRRLR